ncbi:TetR family transcriptional regulator, partial [Dickeya dianthicola]
MSTAAKEKEADVRQRILQEAMTRFAHKGSELTTVREITEATQVNIAAINYHFGSKDGLLQSVLDAVLRPLSAERGRLLDEVERRWGE